MARRSGSLFLCVALCLALCAFLIAASSAFVAGPQALRGSEVPQLDKGAQAAIIGAALTVPQAAHAGAAGYGLLQLGWAVFVISLGPAVLFWIYFNKPELL
eukprot:CAMPEP_0197628238 /NCGR_PEP_ID=MMETSP1338-20131121/6615_1 /TAXON_ID=43686 ORGANISM="Pelagodinium beii, Strain RCC1491" /NCGR_SAMPLE_ID=MMETSP1338 /ASSEMBLY_ACC=CAM_ASM_000754 /LENGTH=100 /DNA_ID=CAMNT_0043199179 /DNA_START=72 /DNA_END=374 /DNA_ORIENTATION=+